MLEALIGWLGGAGPRRGSADVFVKLLALERPWTVEGVDFEERHQHITITLQHRFS